MSLFDVVPERPGTVGSMMDETADTPDDGIAKASTSPAVGRDAGLAMMCKGRTSIVSASDAEIRKNNRAYLLMQVHRSWKRRKALKNESNSTKAVETMGKSKSSRVMCEVCSTPGVLLRLNHGKNMCATCQSIYAHVHNRLPAIAAALDESGKLDEIVRLIAERIGKAALMRSVQPHIPEQVAVNLENDTLDQITEVIGYEGESGEGLIDAVRGLVASAGDVPRLWEIANELGLDVEYSNADDVFQAVRDLAGYQEERQRHVSFLVELREILGVVSGPVGDLLEMVRSMVGGKQGSISAQQELVQALFGDRRIIGQSIADTAAMQIAAQLEDLQRKVAVICLHCGVSDIDNAILQVAHSEAIIDDMLLLAGDLAGPASDIPMLLKLQGEELHNMRINLQAKQDVITLSSDQISDAEQRLLADEQVFARIREVIGKDGIDNVDIPTILQQFLGCVYDFSVGKRGTKNSVDSHLLDLALDAMRGKITGLDPDRIAMLREAA